MDAPLQCSWFGRLRPRVQFPTDHDPYRVTVTMKVQYQQLNGYLVNTNFYTSAMDKVPQRDFTCSPRLVGKRK